MIAFTYLISLLIWPPWIIGWPYIEGVEYGRGEGGVSPEK